MVRELGLPECKKLQTRRGDREAALRLFAKRGFEAVTVTEVAREAIVSQATVFNYFPTKEDLFYERMEVFEGELLGAVRERKIGETVLAGRTNPDLSRAVRSQGERAFDLLEHGLGKYAVRGSLLQPA